MDKPSDKNHLSDDQMASLIHEDPELSERLKQHLDQCQVCQHRLESLAADPWWWGAGQDLIRSSIDLLDQESESRVSSFSAPAFDPVQAEVQLIVKEFAKPNHPELLGHIDGYDVQSLLGVGGMGAVFRGYERDLNRLVALKFLLPRHAQSGLSRQRFSREAKAVAAVRDDNVVPVHRINASGTFPYFVMPLIAGMSLEQFVIVEGSLQVEQTVQISAQIAAGLAAAHEKGLIHRDIKPANILLENHCNRVVITDFGLVMDQNDLHLTNTGVIAGTPQYMSPEQADGLALDDRSDLFSVGAVMYWMATGRPPFQGQSQLKLLKNVRQAKHEPARSVNPNVPQTLSDIIDRLLAKKPSDRFSSAKELAIFLDQYSAHLANPTKNLEPGIRNKSFGSADWKKSWSFFGLATLALLSVVVLGWILNRPQPPDHRPASSDQNLPNEIENSIGMKFKLIPQGTFKLGPPGTASHSETEIPKPFYLGQFEVTNEQFQRFEDETGYRIEAVAQGQQSMPMRAPDPQHPVIGIAWRDAVEFCRWLSRKEGKRYRLPNEAEWEYACRAGSETKFCFGNDIQRLREYGEFGRNHSQGVRISMPRKVGSFQANRFGLFDMHGNVGEWCADWYWDEPSNNQSRYQLRVVRGGSFFEFAEDCTSYSRRLVNMRQGSWNVGFRVVMEAAENQ